jgi:acyl-coenzyme A synthetase/AMP-(fatty) acid ligase
MVLADSLFEWFYDEGFPAHAHLGNISGGTDIAACFAMDNPLSPLYVGGCQGGGLGVPIAVYGQIDEGLEGVDGKALPDGESGELVATDAFPSTPVTFWGEDGPKKYFNAYYARFNSKSAFRTICCSSLMNTCDRCMDTWRFHHHSSRHQASRILRSIRWSPQSIRHSFRISRNIQRS